MVFLRLGRQPRGTTLTIPVTIQPGQALFLPIITVECSEAEDPPFAGHGEAELRACANGLIDLVVDPYAEIDGTPVQNPNDYRVESPLFRYGPLADRNFLGLPGGTQSDSVATGYFLLIEPLSVGTHRIAVRTTVPEAGITVDQEFVVTVAKPGK